MAVRKFSDLANETDSKFNNIKDTKARAKITERFDDTTHNEQPSDEALQYLSKKVDECIDELNLSDSSKIITSTQASAITANTAKVGTTSTERSRIAANHSKVGITTSQASAITANTNKTGITSTQASRITANHAKTGITSTQASHITANNAKVGTNTDLAPDTEAITLKATVTESRGKYTLVFTATHNKVTKTVSISME